MRTRLWIHFWAAFILLIPLGAQAVQDGAIDDPGDIAFVAYHDDDDGFSFVLMDDAPNGTSIRFIDEEWTGAAFASAEGGGEGDVLWTNNTGSTIAKGTVVDIVDADDAEVEVFEGAHRPGDIVGIGVGSKAIGRIVCHGHDLVRIVVSNDRGDGAEGFFPVDLHVGRHTSQDGRRVEMAFVQTV